MVLSQTACWNVSLWPYVYSFPTPNLMKVALFPTQPSLHSISFNKKLVLRTRFKRGMGIALFNCYDHFALYERFKNVLLNKQNFWIRKYVFYHLIKNIIFPSKLSERLRDATIKNSIYELFNFDKNIFLQSYASTWTTKPFFRFS